jgi:hypothetical protein
VVPSAAAVRASSGKVDVGKGELVFPSFFWVKPVPLSSPTQFSLKKSAFSFSRKSYPFYAIVSFLI